MTDEKRHREVSLQFLRYSSGFAVRADRGEKNPGKGWDPKGGTKESHEKTLKALEESSDNLGVHLFGSLVDVDLDNDDPYFMAALERVLPSCPHAYGHGKRRRTHRIYELKEEFIRDDHPLLNRVMKHENTHIEIRGGEKSRGEYSLLPGSIHPSGSTYLWEDVDAAASSPASVTINQLIRAVRIAAVTAHLAPYWVEGTRNHLAIAFSGLLHRAHTIAMETGMYQDEALSPVCLDEAKTMMGVICDVAGDTEEEDRRKRIKLVERTYKASKENENFKTAGGARLAEITDNPKIVGLLYSILIDVGSAGELADFQEEFAILEGTTCVINLRSIRENWRNFEPIIDKTAFNFSYGHRKMLIDGKKVPLTLLLPALSSTTRVKGLALDPSEPAIINKNGIAYANAWRGFSIPPQAKDQSAVAPFLSYVRTILASEDEKIADWVLQWLAHIFQKPAEKSCTALVCVGLPGAGKSFLSSRVIRPIIGDGHSCVTESVSELTGRFNGRFADKLFIHCEEAINQKQRQASAMLKSYITDAAHSFEQKNRDRLQRDTYMRFYFTSNTMTEAVYMPDGKSDRRYTVLRANDVYKDDLKFWGNLIEWSNNPENLAAVHDYLLSIDIDWQFIARPLDTTARNQMLQSSMDTFDRWLAQMVARQHPLAEESHKQWFDAIPTREYTKVEIERTEWPEYVSIGALADDFASFTRQLSGRDRDRINESQIVTELQSRDLLPHNPESVRKRATVFDDRTNNKKTIRPRLIKFPTFGAMQIYMDEHHGMSPEKFSEKEDIPKVASGKQPEY